MTMKARNVMTGDVIVAKEDETVYDAAQKMAQRNVGALPICDRNERLIGMITDRDVVTQVIARGKNPSEIKVGELGKGKPVTIGADDDINEAMRTMEEHQVRRLPVIDGDRCIGMISQGDLAKALSSQQTGKLVETISQ